MTASAAAVAGSSTRVVNANVSSTTIVLVIATPSTSALAPVSLGTRKWAAVTSVNTSSAIALPSKAIELRSNPAARTCGRSPPYPITALGPPPLDPPGPSFIPASHGRHHHQQVNSMAQRPVSRVAPVLGNLTHGRR